MKKNSGIYLLTGAVALMLPAMFVLPYLTVPDQSVISDTLSDLGAQSTPFSWIINSVFAALAFGSVISGWKWFEGFGFHRIILTLFGISLTFASIFNQAPVSPDIPFSISEDGWHSYLMNTTWLTFIILTFSTALILEKPADRMVTVITALSSLLWFLLVSETEKTAGIWQRLQFITGFGWMLYMFSKNEK